MNRRPFFGPILLAVALLGWSCGADGPPDAPDENAPSAFNRTIILISFDGFRVDYMDRVDTPNLDRLAESGVRADEGMIPVFPSLTFPNHYSIVTGLYPAHHGIVSNTMYDPEMDEWFTIRSRKAITDPRWWGGEPLWVTAENQGVKAATYYWVGSEAPVKGVQPSYWYTFDDSVPGPARIDTVLTWLDMPTGKRPGFISVYFSDVDHAGHSHGPDALETAEAVRQVDGYIGRLLQGLDERDLFDAVNVMVVADHGMTQLSRDRVIFLDDYIDLDDVMVVDASAMLGLNPWPGREDAIFEALEGAHPKLQVWRKGDMPQRFHYKDNPRIPDIVGIASDGWSIVRERSWFEEDESRVSGGTHGYDNRLPSMRALFVAHGPAFKNGVTAEPFENIHLYDAMARILGVTPAPNDGDPAVLQPVMKPLPDPENP